MGIVSGGGGSGNTTAQVVASGKVVPVANATGVTVDTTTYNDTLKGSGKLTTLVFDNLNDQTSLAVALSGDAFPRWILASDPGTGLLFGNGTFDPGSSANRGFLKWYANGTAYIARIELGGPAATSSQAVAYYQISSKFTITSGALPTQQLVSGTAAQLAAPGDGQDVEVHTPVTFNPGVATTATCTVAISPDNVTYSTLAVVTKPVGTVFDGTIEDVTLRLPAGWWVKLTVVNATLGLTTYY